MLTFFPFRHQNRFFSLQATIYWFTGIDSVPPPLRPYIDTILTSIDLLALIDWFSFVRLFRMEVWRLKWWLLFHTTWENSFLPIFEKTLLFIRQRACLFLFVCLLADWLIYISAILLSGIMGAPQKGLRAAGSAKPKGNIKRNRMTIRWWRSRPSKYDVNNVDLRSQKVANQLINPNSLSSLFRRSFADQEVEVEVVFQLHLLLSLPAAPVTADSAPSTPSQRWTCPTAKRSRGRCVSKGASIAHSFSLFLSICLSLCRIRTISSLIYM